MTRRKRNATTRDVHGDGYDQPHEVEDLQVVFPADLGDLLPPWGVIPQNFRRHYGDVESQPWKKFQARWFYSGAKLSDLVPRDDVDPAKAIRHLKVIQGSFEPKHEHKEAAVAWLLSRWFKAVS
jgi:hypothetical protein